MGWEGGSSGNKAHGRAEPRLWGWHVSAHEEFGGAGVGRPGAESGGVRCGGLRRPSQGFWIDPYSHASATDDLLTCPLSCSFPTRVSVGFTVPVTVKAVGFRRSLPWLPRQSATTLAAFLLSLGSGNQQSEVSAWVGRERESLPGFPPSFCWFSGNLWSSLAYGH